MAGRRTGPTGLTPLNPRPKANSADCISPDLSRNSERQKKVTEKNKQKGGRGSGGISCLSRYRHETNTKTEHTSMQHEMEKLGEKKLNDASLKQTKKLKVLRELGRGTRPVPERRAQGKRGTREVFAMPPPQQGGAPKTKCIENIPP